MREEVGLSAGHHLKDTGAVSGEYKENLLTIEFRDLVLQYMQEDRKNVIVATDDDTETNTQYQNRLRKLETSGTLIIVDIHFNAASPTANGSEVIVSNHASQNSKDLAKLLQDAMVSILGTEDRGVKPESMTARGRIGILNLKGVAVLPEICFITNTGDMLKYEANKHALAKAFAKIIVEFDEKINSK